MPQRSRTPLPFEIWALVAGGFAVALGYGVVAPAIPQFALAFGVSAFAASAIVSAFALMRLISAPFAGWITGRIGERRTYTIGILIVAISTGATALAENYTQFVLLRAAGGVGSTMFTVAATALLAKLSPPDQRGRVASLNAAGFLLGGLLGPVFGGIVAMYGLRAPFVFYFGTLIVAATVVAISLRGSTAANTSQKRTSDSATPLANDAAAAESLSFRAAARVPQFWALLLSVFTFGWASHGVRVSIIPILVATAWNGDATAAAWVLAAYAAGNALLIFPSGRWNDRWGRRPLLIAGLAVLALTYAVLPAAPSLLAASGAMFVAGAGSALVNPANQAVLADVLARRRGGQVVAAHSMASDLGGVLGPLVAGALVEPLGFGWAFGVTALLLTAPLIVWIRVPDLPRPGSTSRGR